MAPAPEDINFSAYTSPAAAGSFSKSGLFPAEEQLFRQYIRQGMHLLDVGCGTGRVTHHLAHIDPAVIGVDYSEPMIEGARKRFPGIAFQVADVRALPFPDATFDAVVFSFNGLDYLYPHGERRKAIIEIARVLKLGGYFIYSSHNRFRLPIGWRRTADFFANLFNGHLFSRYSLSADSFGKLLTYWGSIRSEKRFFHTLPFQFRGFTGNRYHRSLAVSLLESYTYYVFQKI